MLKDRLNYKLLNLLILCAIAYLAIITNEYWLGFILQAFSIMVPFILAFAFAYALDPFVKYLERKGVRRSLAVAIVIIVVLVFCGGILAFTLPLLYDQFVAFAKSIMEFINDVSTKFNLNLGGMELKITDIFNQIIEEMGRAVSTGTISFVGKGINYIANLFIVLVVGIYFLLDMKKIRKAVKELLKRISMTSYKFICVLDRAMSTYVHSILKLMLVTVLEYTILYRLIGHPNWMLLGVLAGIATLIPYFGGIFTNIVSIITASVYSIPLLIATIVVSVIFSNVDGYIISPAIYGKNNNLSPVGIIFFVAVFGALFGIIGIIVAIPAYILVQTAYEFFGGKIKNKLEDMMDS